MKSASIEDVTEFVLDGTHGSPARAETGIPVLSAQNVKDGVLDFETDRYTPVPEYEDFKKRLSLAGGDVLLTIVGTIGRAAVIDIVRPLVFQRSVAVLRPRGELLFPRYLYHVCQSQAFQAQLARASNQSSQAGVYLGKLKKLRIPLPPLPEQRRVAEILDKADALRAKRRAALGHLDTLTQTIFLDMFGDPAANPKGWPERALGEVFEICSSRRVLERQWKSEGVPFYRAREIVKLAKEGYVDNDHFISEDLFNELSMGDGAPKAGDLMVSAVGTLGACYQVRSGDRFYFKDASVLRLVPKGEVEPAFVRHAFGTDHVLRQVHSGSGSTVGTYTIVRARQTRLYMPPLALQRRFAQLLAQVESQAALYTSGLKRFDSLFTSLQRSAFLGQLSA